MTSTVARTQIPWPAGFRHRVCQWEVSCLRLGGEKKLELLWAFAAVEAADLGILLWSIPLWQQEMKTGFCTAAGQR